MKSKKNGMLYTWNNPSSAANPPYKMILSGHSWSSIKQIKSESKKNKANKNSIFFNQFRFFDDYINDSDIPFFIKNKIEKTEYYLDADMLCRSMLVVGSAGSGKTEQLHNLIQQNWYDKAIIFSKKFEFEEYYFQNSLTDIIVNPKLKVGAIHDILSEDISYIEVFTESLIKAKLGADNNDFFSSAARQRLEKYIQTVLLESEKNDLSIKEKWGLLIDLFENDYAKCQSGDQKSLKDVMETVKQIMNGIYFMAYRVIEDDANTFTAKDFFDKNKPCKLFLSANDPAIESVVAATYAVLTKYQLALPNKWSEKPVLHLQDEYNSLKEMMPERLLIEQREVGRSKMFATIIAVQDLKADKKISQELLVNMQYLSVFGGTDESTLTIISDLVKDVEYEVFKKSESTSTGGINISTSTNVERKKFLDSYKINILQKEGFSHIFLGIKDKLFFKGYTPQVELKKRDYNDFSKINENKFFAWKLEREKSLENSKNKTTATAKSILESVA